MCRSKNVPERKVLCKQMEHYTRMTLLVTEKYTLAVTEMVV